MSMNPEPPQDPPQIRQAKELLRQGQPDEAATTIRRYLAFAPGAAKHYMLLAVALAEAGEGLSAISAMEQATAMEPNDPAIAYNAGLLYRQAGRPQQAVAALEKAIELKPDYDLAKKALEEVRGDQQQATKQLLSPVVGPMGPMRCPHCSMETRSGNLCEFCGKPLRFLDPTEPGATSMMAAAVASAERIELEEGPIGRRLKKAVNVMLFSPGEAFAGALDTFFNSRGAPAAVITLFLISLLASTGLAAIQVRALLDEGTGMYVLGVLLGASWVVVHILVTAFFVAVFNAVSGGSDSFASDFASLALSFAFIHAAITLIGLPLAIPLSFVEHGGIILSFTLGLWALALRVMLVMGATDLSGCGAFIMLLFIYSGLQWGEFFLLRYIYSIG